MNHILGSKQDIENFKKWKNSNLFELNTVDKKNDLNSRANTLLLEYAKQNNIGVEFVDSLLKEYNNDPVAVYDSINKIIKINQNKADITTLPEELSHHLTLALGKDHTLVKRALNLISRLDYRKELDDNYIEAYKDNSDLLKMEYLGKLISKQIVNSSLPNELSNENGSKLWDTIKNLLNTFIKLFKPNTNIESQLDQITSELGAMITSGKKVDSPIQSMDILFQLDKEAKKVSNKVVKEKKQEIYFKRLIKTF